MLDLFQRLLESSFMPHGHCYLWQPGLVWPQAGSDSLMAAAYFMIAFLLFWFVRNREDLAFKWLFALGSLVFALCAVTHVMGVWTIWQGTYWLDGSIKFIAGVGSIVTAVLFVPVMPKALRLPTPTQLRKANEALEKEIEQRRAAEAALAEKVEALEESERKYRLLFEESQESIAITSPKDGVIDVNPACCELWGYSREEILQMDPGEGYEDPEDRREVHRLLSTQGFVREHEVRIRRKDGEKRTIQMSMTPIHGPGGEVEFYQTFARDVTAEKEARQQLRRSERRYRRLFEDAQEGITITTPEGAIIDVNPAICQLSGYSKEELLEMHVAELYVDARDREQILQALEDEGEVRNVVVEARRKDGSLITCEISSTIRRNAAGEIEALQSFVRDVTAEKEAQKGLEESEQMFRTLAEKALIGIALVQDGEHQYVNPAYAEIFGCAPGEIIGESPEMLFHPDDWPDVRRRIKQRIAGERQAAHYEARIRTKSGQTRMVEVSGSRVTYQNRPAIIGTVKDITERREMQREILQIQETERGRIGQELHDGIASQISGTTMVVSAAEMRARGGCPELADQLARIKAILQETDKDLRRVSRGLNPVGLEDGGLPKALEQLASAATVDEGAACRLAVEGPLPELSPDTASHLYRIAQEAVSNAQRHSKARSITIQLRRTEDHLFLTVADDGEGFDPEEVAREGMGLRTMQYRAELLGGTLTIDTAPDQGATCCVQVPIPAGTASSP